METYDEIYTRMKEKYEEESGFEIDSASDIAIRLRVLAGEIYNAETSLEWLKRQMFADTASGEYLDRLAQQRGITRKAATKATGTLTFSVNETLNYPIEIPAGTVAATNGAVPVRVYTTEAAVLPQATYSVTVGAEAELPGYNGNIAYGTAEVPVNIPVGIDAVSNSVFRGGDDEESDSTLRRRIMDSYVNRPNPANAAFYKQLAVSVDGIDKATRLINANRPLGVTASVNRAYYLDYDMIVSVKPKPGYEADEVRTLLTNAFTDFIGTLDVGETLYISRLGKYLYDTGCIEFYEFDSSMHAETASGSQFFRPGDVTIEVL